MAIIILIILTIILTIALLLAGKIHTLGTENKALKKVQKKMSNSLRIKGIEVDALLKKIKSLEKEQK